MQDRKAIEFHFTFDIPAKEFNERAEELAALHEEPVYYRSPSSEIEGMSVNAVGKEFALEHAKHHGNYDSATQFLFIEGVICIPGASASDASNPVEITYTVRTPIN